MKLERMNKILEDLGVRKKQDTQSIISELEKEEKGWWSRVYGIWTEEDQEKENLGYEVK